MPVKFSEFLNGGALEDGDVIVGLEGGANTRFSFTGSGGGLSWSVVDTDTEIESGQGYLTDSEALVTLDFPATLTVGDIFGVANVNTGGWMLNLQAGQSVLLGDQQTSVAGVLSSTDRGDSLRLVAYSTTSLIVLSSVGNIFYA